MVRSTSVTKFAYLLGRYAGAYTAAALGFAAVPLAILIGSQMPWLDRKPSVRRSSVTTSVFSYVRTAEYFGDLSHFLCGCLRIPVDDAELRGCAGFSGPVFHLDESGREPAEMRDTIATIEPFGLGAFSDVTRYWSAAESNSLVPPFEGTLMWNRLIAIALAALALAIAYSRYSFAEKGFRLASSRKNRSARRRKPLSSPRGRSLAYAQPSGSRVAETSCTDATGNEPDIHQPGLFRADFDWLVQLRWRALVCQPGLRHACGPNDLCVVDATLWLVRHYPHHYCHLLCR